MTMTPEQLAKCREAFEKEFPCELHGHSHRREGNGYAARDTDLVWEGYKAAWSAAHAQGVDEDGLARGLVEAMRSLKTEAGHIHPIASLCVPAFAECAVAYLRPYLRPSMTEANREKLVEEIEILSAKLSRAEQVVEVWKQAAYDVAQTTPQEVAELALIERGEP